MSPRLHRVVNTIIVLGALGISGIVNIGGPVVVNPTITSGVTRYIATTGSDGNTGLSSLSPFRTIQHCALVSIPGDTCSIAGGTYRETITPPGSGTAPKPITFQPTTAAAVTVSGADVVGTTWGVASGSIYLTSLPYSLASSYLADCPTNTTLCANQVFVDGLMLPEARWPNPGLDPMNPSLAWTAPGTGPTSPNVEGVTIVNRDTHAANATQPGADTNGWAGAQVNIWPGSSFYMESGLVNSSSTSTLAATGLNYRCSQPGNLQCPNNTNQWYVYGKPVFLASAGMWSYNSSLQQLSVWLTGGVDPTSHVIEVKRRNYAFDLAGRSYITIKNLNITAATVRMDASSSHNLLDTLLVTYPSHYMKVYGVPYTTVLNQGGQGGPSPQTYGLDNTGILINGTSNTIQNSTVTLSAGGGISVQGSYNTVNNNLVYNVDYNGGYGAGISLLGDHLTVTHNTVHDTGRDGIELGSSRWAGFGYDSNVLTPPYPTFANNTIAYNDVYHALRIAADGGEFYGCCLIDMNGTVLSYNFAHDQLARLPVTALTPGQALGGGLYIDNSSFNTLLHHNVTWGNTNPGIPGIGYGLIWNRSAGNPNTGYNNTLGGGDSYGLDSTGVGGNAAILIANSILGGGVVRNSGTGDPTYTTDLLTGSTYVDAAHGNYQLASGATDAIDQGTSFPAITAGFLGSAPDIGAYEFGAPPWHPGCSFAACHDPLSILAAAP